MDLDRSGWSHTELPAIRVSRDNDGFVKLATSEVHLRLETLCGHDAIDRCLEDLKRLLLDFIASKTAVGDEAEVLLVQRSSRGGVWLCRIRAAGTGWRGVALESQRPELISTAYALPENSDQVGDLFTSHEAFMAFAGDSLFTNTDDQGGRRLLRVKVDARERWFLRFPLGVFVKFCMSGFERYSACQWIVTDRTIAEIAQTQNELEKALANTPEFLSYSHIVLNRYSAHTVARDASQVNDGFALVLELLGLFREIALDGSSLSLKWTMNPSAGQLRSILVSEKTRFFFGDFEATGGVWTLGDSNVHHHANRVDGAVESGEDRSLDPRWLAGKLNHVRLMRVFHCNSLYDPYQLSMEPADDGTIASSMLKSGAFFVEASVTAEPVIDYICTMIDMILRRADLRAILFAKQLVGECDVSSLIARANPLLSARGFAAVT